jgi:hypothetical protein
MGNVAAVAECVVFCIAAEMDSAGVIRFPIIDRMAEMGRRPTEEDPVPSMAVGVNEVRSVPSAARVPGTPEDGDRASGVHPRVAFDVDGSIDAVGDRDVLPGLPGQDRSRGMNRRTFLASLGALVALPRALFASQSPHPHAALGAGDMVKSWGRPAGTRSRIERFVTAAPVVEGDILTHDLKQPFKVVPIRTAPPRFGRVVGIASVTATADVEIDVIVQGSFNIRVDAPVLR